MKSNRPRLRLPVSNNEWAVEAVAIFGLAIVIGLGVLYYAQLPDIIPRHINAAGVIDAYGTKSYMIAFFAGIALLMYGFMTLISFYPHWYNYPRSITAENAPRIYRLGRNMIRVIKAEVMWIFVVLEWQFFLISLGQDTLIILLLMPVEAVIFIGTTFYFLIKMMSP